MTKNRLSISEQSKLDQYITRALAQGRLRDLTIPGIAAVCEQGLGWKVSPGNVKGALTRLDISPGRGHAGLKVPSTITLGDAPREVRVAAMNWLTFLEEHDLLELSIWESWPKVSFDPKAGSLTLPTSHGPIVGRVSSWKSL